MDNKFFSLTYVASAGFVFVVGQDYPSVEQVEDDIYDRSTDDGGMMSDDEDDDSDDDGAGEIAAAHAVALLTCYVCYDVRYHQCRYVLRGLTGSIPDTALVRTRI